MGRGGTAILCIVLMLPGGARAADTDVAQVVAAALTKYGKVPRTRLVDTVHEVCRRVHDPDEPPHDECRNVHTQTPVIEDVLLTASNIAVIRSKPLEFGTLVRTELPTEFTVWYQSLINCADAPASQTVIMSKQTAHSESLTVSRSVTNTLGVTVGGDYSFSGFRVSGSVTVTNATASGTARLEGTQETTTRTGSGTLSIPARSTAIAEFRVWPINFELPFTTTVLVDADLSTNNRGLKRLSEVLPEAERTFPIEGHIASREASDGEIIFHSTQNDPAKCSPGVAVVVADRPLDAQTRLILGDRLPAIPAR